MRISGVWNPADLTQSHIEAGKHALLSAWEAGYTLFDHADIYGQGTCESIHGELFKDIPSMRKEIVIATKCGIRFGGDPSPTSPGRYDFRKEYILECCDRSLKRLGIETIDIYQLHRPDLLMDPDEVAEAFDILHSTGRVRYFGVSNFKPSTLSMLQSMLEDHFLVVNQVEISLGHIDCLYDGTLDQCLEENVLPLAWSPLGGGFLGEGAEVKLDRANAERLLTIQKAVDEVAKKHGVSRTVIALAWLLKHPSKIVPIVGSTKPGNIEDAVKADSMDLDREDWYRLLIAAQGHPMP